MTTTFLIANQKGGVGKTTTAVTLAHLMALDGYRVLIVDLDPQGHVALSLGTQHQTGVTDALYRLLIGGAPLKDVILNVRPNLDAIFGDKSTRDANDALIGRIYREQVLINVLRGVSYDVMVIDSPPSASVLNVAAMVVADYLIVPTLMDPLSIDGVNQVLSYAAIVSTQYKIPLAGIIPTLFDRTTKETSVQLEALRKNFPNHMWPPVPFDTIARTAPDPGLTLVEFAPRSPCMIGYKKETEKGVIRIGGYYAVYRQVKKLIKRKK